MQYPANPKKYKMMGVLGVSDIQADKEEFEHQLQQLREARETGGRKQKSASFHTFGLSDHLFTSKFEQGKHHRDFKLMIRQIDENINAKEAQRELIQRQQSLKNSISLLSNDAKIQIHTKITQMEQDEM